MISKRFKYGEMGIAYPVEVGQIWQVGKQHTYVCSDLMESELVDEVVANRKVTLVVCDPPWGQSLANGFRTQAGFERATYDWKDIYSRIAAQAHALEIPLWVEGSTIDKRYGLPIPHLIGHLGGDTKRGYWEGTYFGGNPYGIYYAGSVPPPDINLNGLSGFKITATILTAYPPGVVLDQCGGLGGIPLEAEKAGHQSVSNELSPYRVSKAMARMNELTKQEPVRIL